MTVVEPPEGNYWRTKSPRVHAHYNRGKKQCIAANLTLRGGAKKVQGLVAGAGLFLTNLPLEELEAAGLDYETVHKVGQALHLNGIFDYSCLV